MKLTEYIRTNHHNNGGGLGKRNRPKAFGKPSNFPTFMKAWDEAWGLKPL